VTVSVEQVVVAVKTRIVDLTGPPSFVLALVGLGLIVWPFSPVWPSELIADEEDLETAEGQQTHAAVEGNRETARVPDIRGLPEADGVARLEELGFDPEVERTCSLVFEEGHVLETRASSVEDGDLPSDQDVIDQIDPINHPITVFVSSGDCAEQECSTTEPASIRTVRFGAGAESGNVQVTLAPEEAVAYRLAVAAGQVIDVAITPKQVDSSVLLCVMDPYGDVIAAGYSLQVRTPPLRNFGEHLVLVQERDGSTVDLSISLVVPAA
jgi:hypothetical protein